VQARVCAGVDWAKDDHAIAIIDPTGRFWTGSPSLMMLRV